MILYNRTAQELKLKISRRANTSDEEVSSQEISSRKRVQEITDIDPENIYQSRKPQTAKEDNRDGTIVISSGLSYQVSGTEDIGIGKVSPIIAEVLLTSLIEIATPTHFSILSNSTLTPIYPRVLLLSYCNIDKSITLSNTGTYFLGRTDFL